MTGVTSPSASACSATAPSAPAFAELLERARRRRRGDGCGRRPELAGVLDPHARRLRGDPRGVRPRRRADGRARARRATTCCARCTPGATWSPPTSSCSPSTARSCGRRRASAACTLRFEAAVAGVVPVIRVLPGVAGRRPRRAHPRDRQRDDELHPHRDGPHRRDLRRGAGAGPGARATPRPTRPRTSTAATPPPRWRSSPGWPSARPCTSTRCVYEGIEHITPDDLEYAREFGLSLKLIGTAERVDGGLSVRVHPVFLYGDHPLASVLGPVQRGHRRVRRHHRDHDVGARAPAGRRRRAPCWAT